MKIHLPNSAFIGNIDPFLRSFDVSKPEKLEITANKKWISVHPVVLSIVAALGLTVKQVKCEKLEAASKHYLERMHLFSVLGISSGMDITEHEAAGRFVPLSRISSSNELTGFLKEMIPLLHLEPQQAEPIRYVIDELVRNVLEHAHSQYGAVICAQYYEKSNTIRIGIADTGIGIKESINESHRAATNLEAIRLALMPGITGTTRRAGGTELNAGAGLFYIRSIAKVSRGFFMLYSGDAMFKLLKDRLARPKSLHGDPFKERHSASERLPAWNGTVVGVDIPLDNTPEFSMLLDLIYDAYVKTIRERKKEQYRRPRFT